MLISYPFNRPVFHIRVKSFKTYTYALFPKFPYYTTMPTYVTTETVQLNIVEHLFDFFNYFLFRFYYTK